VIQPDDFVLWRNDPVTQAWMEACEQRQTDAKELLVDTAGVDSVNDNFYRGFIRAYEEMLHFKVDDLNE
jgi:hypothetical protein